MNTLNNQTSVTEEQIVHLLETTSVPLGEAFQQRMAAMPWSAENPQGDKTMTPNQITNRSFRPALALALLALLLAAFVLVTPAGQTMAQSLVRYFQRSSDVPADIVPVEPAVVVDLQSEAPLHSPQVEVVEGSHATAELTTVDENSQALTVTTEEDTPAAVQIEAASGRAILSNSGNEIEVTISETEDGFTAASGNGTGGGGGGIASNNVTLDEAAALLGFPVATITALPAGYQLETVFTPLADAAVPAGVPGPTFVTQYYRNGANTILLSQDSKLEADGNVGETIGDSAVIQTIELAPGVSADYVRGIWVLPESFQPGTDPAASAVWDNNAPDQRLVWETAGVRYELKSNSPDLTMAELVAIAQSLR